MSLGAFRNGVLLGLVVAIALGFPLARAESVIPSQFIAKMYTEALGRAPDQENWSGFLAYFRNNGCRTQQLASVGQQFYTSPEFTHDYEDNEAKLLALYRGALNRDPDQRGLDYYASLLKSGKPWPDVVRDFFTGAEFRSEAPVICNAAVPGYGFGKQVPPKLTPGSVGFTGTEAGLQSILNAAAPASTVYLAQKAVVILTSPLTIPKGVGLSTYGEPETTSYTLMARLVRGSTFDGPNVNVKAGGRLTHVWVDGQRNVLGYHKVSGGAGDNANVASLGGTGIVVSSNKLSDPQGGTNFFSVGAPCANESIRKNLVTAYSAAHDLSGFADGLTMSCEGLDLEYNAIVDVTDVGIVLFATPGFTQHSKIANNTIVSAGLSTNAAISSDPSTGNAGGSSLNYSGTLFQNNTFWTGPNTAFDFGVEAGGRPFFSAASNNSDGFGAVYVNDTTGLLSARVRAGIAVAGMRRVTVTNDAQHPLDFMPVTFAPGSPAATCPGGQVISEASVGHASGTYPKPTFDGDFDGCVNGPFGRIPPNEIRVTMSPLKYDAATGTFDGTVTTENISASSITGPFVIAFVSLSSNATLANATAVAKKTYVLAYPGVLALAPKQSAVVGVEFTKSSPGPIRYDPVIFSGIP
jgi:hypothetical protein